VANAERAAEQIKGLYLRRKALTDVGEAQARAGDRAASIATFAWVRETIRTEPLEPDGWEWREASLSDLAKLQARLGQIDEALAIVRAMKGNEMTTSAILTDGRQVSLDWNRRGALYEIARALAKAVRVDEAFAIAREAERPDLGSWDNGLGVVAEGLVEAGRIDDALRALAVVSDSDGRDRTLLHILRGRLAAGVTAEAERFVAAITDEKDRALAFGEAAAAVLKVGDGSRATALVKQALTLVDRFAYAYQKVEVLAQAMRGLAA
jgi:predicted negative regulator of RcsB-dependent stress response